MIIDNDNDDDDDDDFNDDFDDVMFVAIESTAMIHKAVVHQQQERVYATMKNIDGSNRLKTPFSNINHSNIVVDTPTYDSIPMFKDSCGNEWLYPNDKEVRGYQFDITKTCLFYNTLVALPTGLGKTLIAAVVMFNYRRWFPNGKVIFLAPTRPLAQQQLEACRGIVGIPEDEMVLLIGSATSRNKRPALWSRRSGKHIFFCTPQIVSNDLGTGVLDSSDVVLVIVDEAHKATGEHAYVQVVDMLFQRNPRFRVVALSATPGDSLEIIQQVISKLRIAKLEKRDESDPEITKHTKDRSEDLIVVEFAGELSRVRESYLAVIERCLKPLIGKKDNRGLSIIYSAVPQSNSKASILHSRQQTMRNGLPAESRAFLQQQLACAIGLYHGLETLESYGLLCFTKYYASKHLQKTSPEHRAVRSLLERVYGPLNQLDYSLPIFKAPSGGNALPSHPKIAKCRKLLNDHFSQEPPSSSSRAMVFCSSREAVCELVEHLNRPGVGKNSSLITSVQFVGQSASISGSNKGMTQTKQAELLRLFKDGQYNTIVCTSVAEEGLDIGVVDIIICYEPTRSNTRHTQRMGRTGRKRNGRVIVLATSGWEVKNYQKANATKKSIKNKFKGCEKDVHYYQDSPRMVPRHLNPKPRECSLAPEIEMGRNDIVNTTSRSKKTSCTRVSSGANLNRSTKQSVTNRRLASPFLSSHELSYYRSYFAPSDEDNDNDEDNEEVETQALCLSKTALVQRRPDWSLLLPWQAISSPTTFVTPSLASNLLTELTSVVDDCSCGVAKAYIDQLKNALYPPYLTNITDKSKASSNVVMKKSKMCSLKRSSADIFELDVSEQPVKRVIVHHRDMLGHHDESFIGDNSLDHNDDSVSMIYAVDDTEVLAVRLKRLKSKKSKGEYDIEISVDRSPNSDYNESVIRSKHVPPVSVRLPRLNSAEDPEDTITEISKVNSIALDESDDTTVKNPISVDISRSELVLPVRLPRVDSEDDIEDFDPAITTENKNIESVCEYENQRSSCITCTEHMSSAVKVRLPRIDSEEGIEYMATNPFETTETVDAESVHSNEDVSLHENPSQSISQLLPELSASQHDWLLNFRSSAKYSQSLVCPIVTRQSASAAVNVSNSISNQLSHVCPSSKHFEDKLAGDDAGIKCDANTQIEPPSEVQLSPPLFSASGDFSDFPFDIDADAMVLQSEIQRAEAKNGLLCGKHEHIEFSDVDTGPLNEARYTDMDALPEKLEVSLPTSRKRLSLRNHNESSVTRISSNHVDEKVKTSQEVFSNPKNIASLAPIDNAMKQIKSPTSTSIHLSDPPLFTPARNPANTTPFYNLTSASTIRSASPIVRKRPAVKRCRILDSDDDADSDDVLANADDIECYQEKANTRSRKKSDSNLLVEVSTGLNRRRNRRLTFRGDQFIDDEAVESGSNCSSDENEDALCDLSETCDSFIDDASQPSQSQSILSDKERKKNRLEDMAAIYRCALKSPGEDNPIFRSPSRFDLRRNTNAPRRHVSLSSFESIYSCISSPSNNNLEYDDSNDDNPVYEMSDISEEDEPKAVVVNSSKIEATNDNYESRESLSKPAAPMLKHIEKFTVPTVNAPVKNAVGISNELCITKAPRVVIGSSNNIPPPLGAIIRNHCGISTITASLTTCDIVISKRMAVRRLTQHAILNHKNVHNLLEKLATAHSRPILIVERDREKKNNSKAAVTLLNPRYRSIIVNLILEIKGLRVLFAVDMDATASLIAGLARSEAAKGHTLPDQVILMDDSGSPVRSYIRILQMIPTIDFAAASSTLWATEKWACFRDISLANAGELRKRVPTLKPAQAARIARQFRVNWTS